MKYEDLTREKWNRGQLMAFSGLDGETDYSLGLVARTVMAPNGIEVMSPARCLVHFEGQTVGNVIFGGDFFRIHGASGTPPITAVLADTHHLLVEGACAVILIEETLRSLTKNGRLLIGPRDGFDESLIDAEIEELVRMRGRWVLEQELPEASAPCRRTLARALTSMKGQVYSPEGVIQHRWTTPDRWPHKDMWLWDSAFHAVGWRHFDSGLAMEMIEGMLDLQRADGFLTYRGTPDGPYLHLGDLVTQPPILAHAALLVFEKTSDTAWIKRIYPKLAAYIEWDLKNRDVDGGGLLEWFIEDDETCRSGESGMDNSPRFDSARRLDAVDFNAFLARECEVLARMASTLGRKDDEGRWAETHARICHLINSKCWSEQAGFYFDYDPQRNERTSVWASSGFLPLFCGAASPEQAASLARHLRDPARFATRIPVPSVAVCDESSYSKDMWRGPMWVNINWVIASGFARYGITEEASLIRNSTLLEIERTCEKFGTFFEYFDDRGEVEPPDLLRKGENAPDKNPYRQVIYEFGWTATLYTDFVLGKWPD